MKFQISKAFFLDRDGVVNQNPPEHDYVKSWAEFVLLPTVPQAIELIHRHGYLAIVISNQRGIARGLYSTSEVESIHTRLNSELLSNVSQIDAFYYCPHDISDHCLCRKPQPGLIAQAARDFNLDLPKSHLIGDTDSDLAAGLSAGIIHVTKISTNSPLLPTVVSALKPVHSD